MGYELRRMIRDGAPPDWSPLMRLVATEIADDARDPDGAGELPWSAIPVKGHWDSRGRWREGLAERCGMSERAVSRVLTDLARAGYEMRVAIGTDRSGRPVYAAKGHALRFGVPPLAPRPDPQRPPEVAAFEGGSTPDSAGYESRASSDSPPNSAGYQPQSPPLPVPKPAEFGDPIPSESPHKDHPLSADGSGRSRAGVEGMPAASSPRPEPHDGSSSTGRRASAKKARRSRPTPGVYRCTHGRPVAVDGSTDCPQCLGGAT